MNWPKDYFAFIHDLECLICGAPSPDVAHLRMSDIRVGKDNPGIGNRDHYFVNPLCRPHHDEQHKGKEYKFWQRYAIDPTLTAGGFLVAYLKRDREAALEICKHHRRI